MSRPAELKRLLRSAPEINYYDGTRYSEPITKLNRQNLLALLAINKVYTRLKPGPDSFQIDQENLRADWEKIDWECSDGKLRLAFNNDSYQAEIYMKLMFDPQTYYDENWRRQNDEEKMQNATMRWKKNIYRYAVLVNTNGHPKSRQYLFYSGVENNPLYLNQFGKENSWFEITKEPWQIPVSEISIPLSKDKISISISWESIFNRNK